jgi:hypothetical protein
MLDEHTAAGEATAIQLAGHSDGQNRDAGLLPERCPVARDHYVEPIRLLNLDGDEPLPVEQGSGEGQHLRGLVTMLAGHAQLIPTIVLDEFGHASGSRAAELVKGLPGVTDQEDGDTSVSDELHNPHVEVVHVEGFVDDELAHPPLNELPEGGDELVVLGGSHDGVENVPDVRVCALVTFERCHEPWAVGEGWARGESVILRREDGDSSLSVQLNEVPTLLPNLPRGSVVC